MIYLIQNLALWLLLTAAFSALAGWAFAALRAHPAESAALRERDKLMRDVLAFSAGGEASGLGAERERELDLLHRRADLDSARIAELEHALELARARVEDASARLASLERTGAESASEASELGRLRDRIAFLEAEQSNVIEVAPAPVEAVPAPDEGALALQAWRLRYFEQRVRYLETHAQAAPEAPPVNVEAEWRARTAEARVAYLEEEARRAAAAPPPEPQAIAEAPAVLESPFAANAETDMLMRWRMLYLERRTEHLQARQEALSAQAVTAEETERWKWRTRYLEARVRHLETRPEPTPEPAPEPEPAPALEPELPVAAPQLVVAAQPAEEVAPAPLVPAGAEERPRPLGAARDGAPDDLTLIEGVSQLQQRTLNSLGIYHFDQIADWTPANVAWVDQYLRLRGRILDEEWVEQAADLARLGPAAARRMAESEDA